MDIGSLELDQLTPEQRSILQSLLILFQRENDNLRARAHRLKSLSERILDHIANDDIEEARTLVLEYTKTYAPKYKAKAAILSGQLEKLKSAILTREERSAQEAQIAERMVILVELIEKEAKLPAFVASSIVTLTQRAEASAQTQTDLRPIPDSDGSQGLDDDG
jgi:hypothetical protein